MSVGPHSNPAQLNKTDILTMFSSIYTAAENSSALGRTRFLSRHVKSTTSIKDSDLWIGIGQYTITDRGTYMYLTILEDLQRQTTLYKKATDSSGDFLLNPAHIPDGNKAANAKMADSFAQ
ncbi:hypothetical protein BO82DRAFT_364034 [Aspergillus uvarum CBS 121591]|uniref:Uncharacterized protein n=1 Tax=Aspergillus uvarum CBS 121591 TaxID=1448315 RepID=A0A319CA08_9EURO|nr:hypothetical protein BO82DRAFT_364034 [Aspergillus uvarum CBS 121591]PYH82636.1 hypothetical protein BO82DRAFT_364034 [Aspergillus uvarum CBS 121591]